MRILIAEDEFISRKLLQTLLKPYGEVHVAVDGVEAVEAFSQALASGERYDLVCLDIMMPDLDGNQALKRMREMERERDIRGGAETKVLMVTALSDAKTVVDSYYRGGATGYLVKPIEPEQLRENLREMGFTKPNSKA